MAKTKAARGCCNNRRAKSSLVPSDTAIIANCALYGILAALVMLGVPFVMALAKQAGWY